MPHFFRLLPTLFLLVSLTYPLSPLTAAAHSPLQSDAPSEPTSEPSWSLTGEASDSIGAALSSIGDVNGDGFDDVAVLRFDDFLIYFGSEEGLSLTPDLTGAQVAPSGSFYPKSVAAAGDVNGDGFDDLLIGDTFRNSAEVDTVGSVRLFYGDETGFQSGQPWEVSGTVTDGQFGHMVDGLGDVNGDGFADIAIAAPGTYSDDISGIVFVYYGSADGLGELPNFTTTGYATDSTTRFGESISGAGDVNGDGFDDMIVSGGDAEVAYLYLGSEEGLSAEPVSQLLPEEYDYIFAEGIQGLGDINGDGFDDVIVDAENIDDTIKAYLFYGSADGLNELADHRIVFSNPDNFDGGVAEAGDLNGDGYMDLALYVTAPGYQESGSGTVYLYYGSEDGLADEPSGIVSGSEVADEFGLALNGAGDVNGDGFDELLIGAPNSTEGGDYAGKAYLFHGSAGGISGGTPAVASGPSIDILAELSAPESGSLFGYQATGVGDVNGDGYVDLLATALYANDSRGAAYLYLGTEEGLAEEPIWTAEGESRREDFGYFAGSAGDLNGDGYTDLFVTAPYYEGGLGKVYVYYGTQDGPLAEAQWWVVGNTEDSLAGSMASGVGDINGDGFDDFAVSVQIPLEDETTVGQMILYYGSEDGLPEEPGFVTEPTVDIGSFAARAGDVNGDGFADLIVAPALGAELPGSLGVLHGSADGLVGTLAFLGEGENDGDYYGYDAIGTGDVNGDGFDDLLVGIPGVDDATGVVHLYLGGDEGLASRPDWQAVGEISGIWFGATVAALGDINGDGYADFAVGEAENSEGPTFAHIFAGGSNGPESIFVHEVELLEPYDWDMRISPLGDLDQDGLDDYLITEPGYPDGAEDGRVVIYGMELVTLGEEANAPAPTFTWTPSREQQLDGGESGEAYGWQTVIIQDVNGDGYDELAVASFGNPALELAGRLVVYYGSNEGVLRTPDWEVSPADWPALVDADGEPVSDLAAFTVASLGDVNGDGYNDLGLTLASTLSDASHVLVYHGSADGLAQEPSWLTDAKEPFAEIVGARLVGLGDVNGDGFADMGIVSLPIGGDESARFAFYYGSEDGFSEEPAISRTIPVSDDFFMDLAAVGDLNDDGYADILFGLPFTEVGDVSQVNVLVGSEDGIDLNQVWEANSETEDGSLGLRVAGLGDIDGNGTPDFATAELIEPNSNIVVYLNRDEVVQQTLVEPNGLAIGMALNGVGDINGDGYADLLTSAIDEVEGMLNWQIYAGGPDGVGSVPIYAVALAETEPFYAFFQQYGSGDLDGDGYDDIALVDIDFAAMQAGDSVSSSILVLYGGESVPIAVDDGAIDHSAIAEEPSEILIDESSTSVEGFWETGTELLLDGDYDEALTQFDLAIEADPTFAPAHNGRGRVFLVQEQYLEALEDFDRAIEADPAFWQAYFNQGTIYYILESYEEALPYLDEVVALVPEFADTYYWRGFSHLGLEDIESATADFETHLGLDPDSPYAEEVSSVLADLLATLE